MDLGAASRETLFLKYVLNQGEWERDEKRKRVTTPSVLRTSPPLSRITRGTQKTRRGRMRIPSPARGGLFIRRVSSFGGGWGRENEAPHP